MRRIAAIAASAACIICAPALAQTDDYPVDFRAKAQAWFEDNLRDPDGSDIQLFRPPAWSVIPLGLFPMRGWGVCYNLNARNAYGGRVGREKWVLLFRNGRVFQGFHEGESLLEDAGIARECAKPPMAPPAGVDISIDEPGRSPEALAKQVGELISIGNCHDARNLALRQGDLDLARKVDEVCRPQ